MKISKRKLIKIVNYLLVEVDKEKGELENLPIKISDVFKIEKEKGINNIKNIDELVSYLESFSIEKPYPEVLSKEESELRSKISRRINLLEYAQDLKTKGVTKTKKSFAFPIKDSKSKDWKRASSGQKPSDSHSGYDWPGAEEGDDYIAIANGVVKSASSINKPDIWKNNYSWYSSNNEFGSGYGEILEDESPQQGQQNNVGQDIASEPIGEPEEKIIKITSGANIVYQAFPGLSYYPRFGGTLVSGPKGLENFWNSASETYTGTYEQTEALVDAMDNRIDNETKERWKNAIQVTERGNSDAPGSSKLEKGKGGKGITLELIDPEDGTTFQFYCGHLDNVFVSRNENVKKGQKIGTFGDTGRSFGAHPHFELRYYSKIYGTNVKKRRIIDLEVWKNLFSRMETKKERDLNPIERIPKANLDSMITKRSSQEKIKTGPRLRPADLGLQNTLKESHYSKKKKHILKLIKKSIINHVK